MVFFSNWSQRAKGRVKLSVMLLGVLIEMMLLTGCGTGPIGVRGPVKHQPELVPVFSIQDCDRALKNLGEMKRQLYPQRNVVFTIASDTTQQRSVQNVRGVPGDSLTVSTVLEGAFSPLADNGVYFVPPADFNIEPQEVLKSYQNPDGTAAEVYYIRASAFFDRSLSTQRQGTSLQALIPIGDKALQPEVDWETEREYSRLGISMFIQALEGHITSTGVELTADMARENKSTRAAVLFYGSGGSVVNSLVLADGLNSSLQVITKRATMVLVGRTLGLPYQRLGFGHEADPMVERAIARLPQETKQRLIQDQLGTQGYGAGLASRARYGHEQGVDHQDDTSMAKSLAHRVSITPTKSESSSRRITIDVSKLQGEEATGLISSLWKIGPQKIEPAQNSKGEVVPGKFVIHTKATAGQVQRAIREYDSTLDVSWLDSGFTELRVMGLMKLKRRAVGTLNLNRAEVISTMKL